MGSIHIITIIPGLDIRSDNLVAINRIMGDDVVTKPGRTIRQIGKRRYSTIDDRAIFQDETRVLTVEHIPRISVDYATGNNGEIVRTEAVPGG